MLPKERLRKRAERLLEKFLREVAEKYKPSCVILFGSYSRGDFTESSDIDVCVISSNLPSNLHERRTIYHRLPGINAIGYTPREFEEEVRRGNPLALDIILYGRPLMGEQEYRRLRKIMEEVVREMGLVRDEHGWRRARGSESYGGAGPP